MPSPPRSSRRRSAISRVRLTLASAAVAALALTAAGTAAGATVSVFPVEGSRVASEHTQITFRGVPISELGTVTVTGRRSGKHSGKLVADSDGRGGSFIPARPFAGGERVTVTAGVPILGGQGDAYSFITAKPAPALTLGELGPAPRVKGDLQSFKSRPDLQPAATQVLTRTAGAGTGDIFVGPQNGPKSNGAMLLDQTGRLIYYKPVPVSNLVTDFRVQTLNGSPVLTWWQGRFSNGVGLGAGEIYNTHYQPVATVRAGNGLSADLHEFQLTPSGTALITSYQPVYWDSRSAHLSSNQVVLDCVVQEIDIKTGLVLYQWDSLDHVPITDSFSLHPKSSKLPFDYFHINSIQPQTDGNIVISGRNTWAGYKLDHSSGAIIWTLGGKHSSFTIPKSDQFAWQHDIRVQSPTTVSVFDDSAGDTAVRKASRGAVLYLDFAAHTAKVIAAYQHTPGLLAFFEGNTQVLPTGNLFLGWGQHGYFTEFSSSGQVQFDMRFVDANSSYRGYRFAWAGEPVTRPSIAARSGHGRTGVYASWNGAQNVAAWRVLAGSSASRLSAVATTPNQGFETRTSIVQAAYVSAQPLDASGRVLGQSKVIKGG